MMKSYDQEQSEYIRFSQLTESGYTLQEIESQTNKLLQFICTNNLRLSFSLDILESDFKDKDIEWLIKYSQEYYSQKINKNCQFYTIKFNTIPYENEYKESVKHYELPSIEYFTHLFPIYFTSENKPINVYIKGQQQQKNEAKMFQTNQQAITYQIYFEFAKYHKNKFGCVALVISGQKNYIDVYKSLLFNKITDGSVIDVVPLDNQAIKQIPYFNIIDTQNIPNKINFIQKEPQYRIVDKGLNIEGYCKNKVCGAYQQLVIYNTGIGAFDLIKNRTMINCPECKKYFKPIQLGFTLCSYNIFAKYIDDEDGETKFMLPIIKDVSGNFYNRYVFEGKEQQLTFLQFTIFTEDVKKIPEEEIHQPPQLKCCLCTQSINNQEKQNKLCDIHISHTQCLQEIKESKYIMFSQCPSCERSG